MSAEDTSEVMLNDKLVKPLSELSVHEVGTLLEALKLGKYKETLISNEIDGKSLMECNTSEDVVNMGITIFVKARVFLNEIMIWKASGVPLEYFSVDRIATDRDDDRIAEDMIAALKVDNRDDRNTDDVDVSVAAFVDCVVMLSEVGSEGDNDHEGSIVDDACTIEPVFEDNVTDEC